jgi:hypothetical protein
MGVESDTRQLRPPNEAAGASWRGVAAGVLVATALPITYLVCAFLVSRGYLDLERLGGLRDLLNSLSLNASVASLLALLGLWMVGRAAGIRRPWVWLTLLFVGVAVVAFLWFVTYVTLGAAMGSPF